jgi:hypothetical protein
MIEDAWPLLAAILFGIAAVFVARKTQGPKEVPTPPKNRAAGAARATIQQTFEDEVGGIQEDMDGSDPAGDLADRGNARNR